MTRSVKENALILVRGMAMGAADVVPGVSGGTIAFITGIYDELLHSLKNIGPAALMVLFKQGFGEFWRHINGTFLVCLFVGILISIKTFAQIISFCLDSYPLIVWGFFSGLIAASIILLFKKHPEWRVKDFVLCAIGALIVVGISLAKPAQVPGTPIMLFFGGFIAICAMILPGISGSFLLLLMGLYPVFLAAINELDIMALGCFAAGCISGLLVFSRFLSWLLDRFYTQTLALLVGFLIGSLNVTWPWKVVLQTMRDRHGDEVPLVQRNVWPWNFEDLTQTDTMFWFVVISTCGGIFLVLFTEYIAKRLVVNRSNQ
ncbi:hypothetical protein TDB9533_01523 [Thalassocella blandensis]|nr:hypothetical protein TDB9533_01523 [Thalassocella blandensis]